jgi:hypothetical protein
MIILHIFFYESFQEPIKTHLFIFLGEMDQNEEEKNIKKIVKKISQKYSSLNKDDTHYLHAFFGDQYNQVLGLDKEPNVIIHYLFHFLDINDILLYDLHAYFHKYCVSEIYGPNVNTPLYIWHNMLPNSSDNTNSSKTSRSVIKQSEKEIPTLFHYKSHEKETFYFCASGTY